MKKVTFYDGYGMTNNGVRAFIEDWGSTAVASPNFRDAAGSFSRFAGSRFSPFEFVVVVELDNLTGGVDIDETRNRLLSLFFDETDLEDEHRIDVLMDNGVTNAYRMVAPVQIVELKRTFFKVQFRASRGEWINVNRQYLSQTITPSIYSPASVMIPVDLRDTASHPDKPTASSWPTYRVKWTSQRSTSSVDFGWKYEQIWRITNGETAAMRNECILINLGDTRALVTGSKARSDAEDVRVWFNGKELRRDIINWNTRITYLWVTIDEIPSGSYIDLSIVYGNPSATNPPRLQEGITRPAFNIFGTSSRDTLISSSTSNTLTIAASTWYTDMWNGAVINVWDASGANNQTRVITSNTGSVATVDAAWSVNPTNTWAYTIAHSSNVRRTFWTKPSNHGSWSHGGALFGNRGGWSLNKLQNRPTVVRFADQVPGAWSRIRVLDNNDRVSQPRYSWIDTGSGDYDAFALFDTTRGQGQARKKIEDGQYDGVMISSVHGWTRLDCNYIFYNPIRTSSTPTKGSCNFKIMTMDEGGEDWSDLFVDGTAQENYTQRSVSSYDLSADKPRHIGFALVGRDQNGNDTEITTKLRKDKIANARWGDFLYMEQSVANWSVSQVQAETEKYDMNVRLRMNGASSFDDVALLPKSNLGELRFGGGGHRIMLGSSEQIVYDTLTSNVEIRDLSGNLIRRVPYAARSFGWEVGSDGSLVRRVRRDAMALRPPREYINNNNFPGNITGWTAGGLVAGIGGVTYSVGYASVGGFGGLDINITANANTGVQGVILATAQEAGSRFAVVPGQYYTITGRIRSSSANLFPVCNFLWYDGNVSAPTTDSTFNATQQMDANMQVDTWFIRQFVYKAPAWAKFATPMLQAVAKTNSAATGHVYFDLVTTTDAILVSEPYMGQVNVVIEYEEGWQQ